MKVFYRKAREERKAGIIFANFAFFAVKVFTLLPSSLL